MAAEERARSHWWDRLREERLAAIPPQMRETEGWDRIIRDTTFRSMSAAGAFSEFWEENAWWPLTAKRLGASAPAIQATLASYMGAASSSKESVTRVDDIPPRRPPAAEGKQTQCKNCWGTGHYWWECTPLTGVPLDDRLVTIIRAKGAPPKAKGAGGKSSGNGGKPFGDVTLRVLVGVALHESPLAWADLWRLQHQLRNRFLLLFCGLRLRSR